MTCSETVRAQAYADGEVDALAAAEVEKHLESCADCRGVVDDIGLIRTALRAQPQVQAPRELRAQILRAVNQGTPPVSRKPRTWRDKPFWWGAGGGAAVTALAAALVFFALTPAVTAPLQEQLIAAHVRSLMPAHLIDVESTDQHTVKPWFAGHADVSPLVVDYAAQGYRLVGGRADYVDHQRAAVVVYEHGRHTINVFAWAGAHPAPATNTTRSGYRMAFFHIGDLAYCAVSDTGWDELLGLVHLIQESNRGPVMPTNEPRE